MAPEHQTFPIPALKTEQNFILSVSARLADKRQNAKSHLQEEHVGRRDLVLHSDDRVRERQYVPGEAVGLFPHQLLLLLRLLLYGGQSRRFLLLQEVTQLLKVPSELLLRGLSLVLTHKHKCTQTSQQQ